MYIMTIVTILSSGKELLVFLYIYYLYFFYRLAAVIYGYIYMYIYIWTVSSLLKIIIFSNAIGLNIHFVHGPKKGEKKRL